MPTKCSTASSTDEVSKQPDRSRSRGGKPDSRSRPGGRRERRSRAPKDAPEPSLQSTTLWEFPTQDYGPRPHGTPGYEGATPAWVVWDLLTRYTREDDLVVDPMVGGGTTLDVSLELRRRARCFDINPIRDDIERADARRLPLDDAAADFVFVDPPYSTHITYSDEPDCIGRLDALDPAYFEAMESVIAEIDRVLKPRRFMALYVSDSYRKGKPFIPIGFELFAMLRERFEPVDIAAVVRGNRKLGKAPWHREAVKQNYFLRGFNYLFIMKKTEPRDVR
jgi:adenine-specific DNA-methyltransferase